MKFRKLLAGTAVAALMAGNAAALDVELGDTANQPVTGTNIATAIVGPVGLALEGNNVTTAGANAGLFVLDVRTDADIAAAGNYIIGVRVIGGEFARNIVADDLLDGEGDGPSGNAIDFSGTTVQFDGSDRTGEAGDDAVRFLSSATTGGSDFRVAVPVVTDCTTPVTFQVSLRTEAGTPIEEGSAFLVDSIGAMQQRENAVTCVEAFRATIATDVLPGPAPTDQDSFLTVASDFEDFSTATDQPLGSNDTATEASIGTITLAGDPSNSGLAIYANLSDAGTGGAGALDTVNPFNEVNDVEFTVTVDQTDGIEGININGANQVDFDAAAPANALDYTAAGLAANVSEIRIEITGGETVEPTQPVASSATVDFSNVGLTDEVVVLPNGGALDTLNYEGGECGNFDWVGDTSATRRNVFRVTNFADAVAQGVFATMTNSSAGVTAGTERITPAETDSELVITDATLTAAFGNYGRADFTFLFVTADDTTLDCDRLMSSPAASIVTPFGNGTGLGQDGDDN